ncbi:MAG: rhomboid family intramembrane serine protease [Parachlamydiaceae bacterium]|nr:rhomboid family intramembrane serine protease [Parachlamydiaceae bacterium]
MRLISTLQDEQQGILLSKYLKTQGIDNELEITTNGNLEDPSRVDVVCRIWVRDEEHFKRAIEISQYPDLWKHPVPVVPAGLIFKDVPGNDLPLVTTKKNGSIAPVVQPIGLLTIYLLVNCCLIFFLSQLTQPSIPLNPKVASELSLPFVPLYDSPLTKNLLFDYPKAYESVDELADKASAQNLKETNQLPADLMPIVEQFRATPYWKGFYEKIVSFYKNKEVSWASEAPLFEKIHQGEWWRLISPILLHGDIFHILFNMMWLVVLGKQLEQQMGIPRYFIFIVLAALVTNTAQYLMSGANFVGFSGVICAMITFVWMRQRKAPWEGYLLQPLTFNFTMLFLGVILLIQMSSFYTEVAFGQSMATQIANTAHMSGLLLGLILGNLDFFAWKQR